VHELACDEAARQTSICLAPSPAESPPGPTASRSTSRSHRRRADLVNADVLSGLKPARF
jgi:hypothetical protein